MWLTIFSFFCGLQNNCFHFLRLSYSQILMHVNLIQEFLQLIFLQDNSEIISSIHCQVVFHYCFQFQQGFMHIVFLFFEFFLQFLDFALLIQYVNFFLSYYVSIFLSLFVQLIFTISLYLCYLFPSVSTPIDDPYLPFSSVHRLSPGCLNL